MIRPVISRMFQIYTRVPQKGSECPYDGTKKAISFGKQSDVVEFYHSMGLTKEEVQKRQKALTEYIASGMKTDNVELDPYPVFREIFDMPVNKILDYCGDDLAKIDKLTGLYGLVKYAAFPPKGIISSPNPNIKETGYYTETIASSFDDYLIHNHEGHIEDLYKRYGECGKFMCKLYSDPQLGYLRQDKDRNNKPTYNTTPTFWNANGINNNFCHMK